MIGQTKSFKEKQLIADEFIKRTKLYDQPQPLRFDLRGYAKYLKDHNLSGKEVPEEIVKKFQV